jgi:hypothetical protein
MKKILIASLIGIAGVTAFGQGAIQFDNYTQGTYNQVCYPNGVAVNDVALQMQLYFGEGAGLTFAQLTPGVTGIIDTSFTYVGANGPGGWFSGATQLLPTWQAGDVFTFCVVVTGPPGYFGQSALWTETTAIHSTMVPVSGFLNFPGINVPEPGTLGLVGLGCMAMASFRRFRSK